MKKTVAIRTTRYYINNMIMKESKMKTYQILISESQLNLIKESLKKDSSYSEEENLLIGIIEDTLESEEEDIIHGFCY